MPKKYPGNHGPDPTNHDKVGREMSEVRGDPFHGHPSGQGIVRPVAAPDVALPHMAHGEQRDSGFNRALPPAAQAPNRARSIPRTGPGECPPMATATPRRRSQPSRSDKQKGPPSRWRRPGARSLLSGIPKCVWPSRRCQRFIEAPSARHWMIAVGDPGQRGSRWAAQIILTVDKWPGYW